MNTKPSQFVSRFYCGAAVLLVAAAATQADVFRVPQDMPTISSALAKASDFDVILVSPGKYQGFMWGDKLVTVRSTMGPGATYIVGGVIFEASRLPTMRQLDGFTITGAKEGLMFMAGGGGHILNCMAIGNDDSGVRVNNATVILENCLIANNNRLQSMGCGIYNTQGIVHGVNLTVVGNYGNHGAGICDYSLKGESTYTNCVVWSNGPAAIDGNAQFSFCNTEQWTEGFANICEDPRFADPDQMNFTLGIGSPCIDAGDNDAVSSYLTRDLAGNARFADDPLTIDTGRGKPPVVDMGAFEFQPPLVSEMLHCYLPHDKGISPLLSDLIPRYWMHLLEQHNEVPVE